MYNIRFTHGYTEPHTNMLPRLMLAIPAVGMVLFFLPSTQAAIPQPERDALIALFNNLGGIGWINRTGWLGLPESECNWYGVTCDAAQTSVTGLNLSGNGLVGSIPVEVGRLAGLQTLNLNGASVWSIPDEIGNLANLQVLELGGTDIFGIPSALGNLSQLQILFVSSYWLGGSIPARLRPVSARSK